MKMPARVNEKNSEFPACMARKARILLVDDHPIFRRGLAALLEPECDMVVCAEAVSARDALIAVKEAKPDLAIIDVSLSGSHGIDLIKDLKVYHPDLLVIILSMHDEMLYAESALRAGAKGYITKSAPPEYLLAAIRAVLRGRLAFSQQVTERMLQGSMHNPTNAIRLPLDRLSDRERQILELIGQGITTSQIAQTLHISVKTVQSHRENLKAKLEVDNGLGLTRFAVHWLESEKRVHLPRVE